MATYCVWNYQSLLTTGMTRWPSDDIDHAERSGINGKLPQLISRLMLDVEWKGQVAIPVRRLKSFPPVLIRGKLPYLD